MDGTRYTGLITGEMVLSTGVRGSQSIEVYFTDDERVILYDADKLQYRVLDDPEVESAIRNLAEDDDEYIDVMESLGRPARIRLYHSPGRGRLMSARFRASPGAHLS